MIQNQLYQQLFAIISFQFDSNFAEQILQDFETLTFKISSRTGKIKQIQRFGDLIATYQSSDRHFFF